MVRYMAKGILAFGCHLTRREKVDDREEVMVIVKGEVLPTAKKSCLAQHTLP